MNSINLETLLTIIFVWVDDWYQIRGREMLKGKVGDKPNFHSTKLGYCQHTFSIFSVSLKIRYNGFTYISHQVEVSNYTLMHSIFDVHFVLGLDQDLSLLPHSQPLSKVHKL